MNSATQRTEAKGLLKLRLAQGSWMKISSTRYERVTGEVVAKYGSRWMLDGYVYSSLGLALRKVDGRYE